MSGKALIAIGVVGLFVVGYAVTPKEDAAEVASTEATTESTETPPDIRIQARGSRCLAVASEARIYLFMSLRNFSDVAGSIDVVPIRRYSDGTTNDSVLDTMIAEVGPLERKTFRTPFDYNALEHELLECRLRVVGTDKEIPILAEQG